MSFIILLGQRNSRGNAYRFFFTESGELDCEIIFVSEWYRSRSNDPELQALVREACYGSEG